MKAWLTAIVALVSTTIASETQCHSLPEDSCWPSSDDWSQLNTTVGGRLVATIPIGTPCHDPTYDAAACATLRASWTLPQTHLDSSSSVMQTYFANQSCDAFTPKDRPCLLGNYVNYAVNVSINDDVVAAIQFAQKHNIRFVIRNTGHDYLGRSTGAGALSVWTHHLNSITSQSWSDSKYQGPAFKVGAGVLGYQILEASTRRGLVVVTGECPTVGLAGGYTQGGGHSALSTAFGLGADQPLQFEVVTAAGKVVNASHSQNTDLFWALSGGGGGNYGVVTAMTVKAHRDATIGGAQLAFSAAGLAPETFIRAVSLFHRRLPAMIDRGVTVIYQMTSSVFSINPVTGYNMTSDDIQSVLQPFLSELSRLNITYKASYTQFDSYYDHYNKYMGPLPYGNLAVSTYQYGGRLIPRDVLQTNSTELGQVLHNITEQGVIAVGVGMDVSHQSNASNAVFPALRNAAVTMQIGTLWNETAPWSQMVADQSKMTKDYVAQLEAITPGSGCYQNEANFRQPNWKETFFGSNYAPLLSIKRKWDPHSFFYVFKGVGSDSWHVSGSGRMCQTHATLSRG